MRAISLVGAVCAALVLAAVPTSAQLRTQLVAQGLSAPVAFVPDPTSTTRFFVVQQGGLIRVLENGVLLPTPLLDLRPPVILAGGEQGLLGMAFAPDAATSGRFFVNFTSPSGDIVVARFRRSPATASTADPGSRFDLVWPGNQRVIPHPRNTNHNGGHLAFGPDGYLYIGTGDGGGFNDPDNNAQDPFSLLGKMLRIDVNVPDNHPTGYRIPSDNPFVDAQPLAALGEIWAFGLRNPWRYSFDDRGPGATGALIIGDVGQGAREEVDYEPAGSGGRNYGWSIREGTIATPGITMRTPAFQPLVNPLFDYNRSIGQAITGGYVYRGSQLPAAYRGRYFVGDSSSSIVASVGLSINPATREAVVVDAIDHTAELGGSLGGVISFGRDHEGELYVLTFSRILKIVAADTPGAPSALGATVAGRTVQLQWSPPAGGAAVTGYRLEAGSAPGAANLAVFATGTTPGLGVGDVPDGTYFVRVRGLRGDVAGPPSNEVQVVVAACPLPGPPGGLARIGSGSTVVLNWTAASGATSYRVEAGSAPGLANLASLDLGAALSLSTPAPPGVYYVRVRGLNGCGSGPPSADLVVRVP